MDLSQLNKDMDILKSCINTIVTIFSPEEDQLFNPDHQHQQKFPLQPKMYETTEDAKRMRDWAISVVKCGINSRDTTIEVSVILLM